MYCALAESGFQFLLLEQFYICRLGLNHLFAWTVFFSNDPYYVVKSTVILQNSGFFLATLCFNLSLTLNSMLCLDLILMVRNPFQSKESRLPKYVIVSILLSLPVAYMQSFVGNHHSNAILTAGCYGSMVLLALYLILFLASIVYTMKKLSKQYFSKTVLSLVLKRHVLTSVVYLVTNLFFFLNLAVLAFYKASNLNARSALESWWVYMLKILFASQGFAIPLLRLSEPFFYQIVARKLRQWCTVSEESKR